MKQGTKQGLGFENESLEGAIPSRTCSFTKFQILLGSLFVPSVGLRSELVWQLANDGYSLGPHKTGAIKLKAFPPMPWELAGPGSWLKLVALHACALLGAKGGNSALCSWLSSGG